MRWHEHIRDWVDRPRVTHVTYEGLHADGVNELLRIMEGLGVEPDRKIAGLAVDRWSMTTTTRRNGQEDRTSFQRKGVAGDWVNHFNRQAGEVFDSATGDALVEFGYEVSRDWYRDLPQ